jgi:hypothetical protein
MTPSDFRRLALTLEGATEGSHMGHFLCSATVPEP